MTATPPPPPPATPPPSAPPPGSRTGGGAAPKPPKTPKPHRRGTWLIAIVALLVSVLSLVVAGWSLSSARSARDEAADAERLAEALSGGQATPPAGTNEPAAPPATNGPALPTGPPGTPAPPQSFDPQAAFAVKYSDEVLNPQVTDLDPAYIDLDEPRIVFDSGQADLVLDYRGLTADPPYFDLQNSSVAAAELSSPDATPEDCLEQLRTGPLPGTAEVPAQRGTVLCVRTSSGRAAEQGITQIVVVMYVSALGDDGRVTIELDAWHQPS